MGKSEIFAIVVGIIGLVSDGITILDKIQYHPAHTGSPTGSGITLFVFSTAYGWFILSWFLVKWNYSRQKQGTGSRRKISLEVLSARAVFMVGAILFPFVAYVGYSAALPGDSSDFLSVIIGGVGGSAFAMGFAGFLIWLALSQGMPLIYDDIRWS